MSNIDAFANSFPPDMPGIPRVDDFSDGTFPTDTDQPETQGDDPVDAELGDDGQGDLAPEDEVLQHSGDAPTDLRDGTE
ncbi:hypothetical protein BMW26_00200 [Microbacterium sp. 1.5R]|uniref:hypothetical protein n=1 Tax=Microbacterium sp. 1.5R TaxID=1916917 RepID=UPI00090BD091|nr:hypothetical protein [Microbacterium sp. 1.5R]APH43551.1 hypothetical protein BMW26_00200 [Microbacterium sp. 1.5R]